MKQKVIWILGLWAAFAVWNFLTPQKSFSEAENRYLQEKPEPDGEDILDGSYMEDYEIWMADQLLFRDGFVSLKASADRLAGQGDSGGVYLGKDGYLLEMFTERDWEEKREQFEKNVNYASSFLARMEEEGKRVHFLMVPTGSCIMAEKLPAFAPEVSQDRLFEELSEKLPGFVDCREELLAAKGEEQLYYRTDHHWTSMGAWYAYRALARAEGRELPELTSYTRETLSTEFYGTSYAKAGLYTIKPDTMEAIYPKEGESVRVDYGDGVTENTLYDRSFLSRRDKYRVFLKGNYPLTKIETAQKNGKRLLLVKDSFANTFIQFLTEDYEEIHVIDPRYFKMDLEEYTKDKKITDVLFLYQIKNFAEVQL